MQWSKLKSDIKGFICPELKDVIDFHVTQYRKAHGWISESWITVNGEKIFNCGSRTYARESAYELFRHQESSADVEDGEATLPDIRAVGPWNPELQTYVCAKELIRAVLAHTAETEHLVEQQVGRNDQAVTQRRDLS